MNANDENRFLKFHGTSIEGIEKLFEEGRMPNKGLMPNLFYITTDRNSARRYAKQIAVRYYLYKVLPFEVPSHYHILAAQSLVDSYLRVLFKPQSFDHMFASRLLMCKGKDYYEEMIELSKMNGISKRKLSRIVRKGYEERNGCLLFITQEAEEELDLRMSNGDIIITTPEGLDIKYIHNIECLGDYEKRIFERLENNRRVP